MKQAELVKLLTPLAARADLPQEVRGVVGEAIAAATSPLQFDVVIYRVVVIVLGITVIATVFGGLYLATKADPNIKLPDAIVAIGCCSPGMIGHGQGLS